MKQIQKIVSIVMSLSFVATGCVDTPQPISTLLITPSTTKTVAVVSDTHFVPELNKTELELPKVLSGYSSYIMSVTVSPDDSVIAGGICYITSSNTGIENVISVI